MSEIKPGTRVVRGPDWISKKQDNGEGFLGTVIFVPKPGSDDKKVTVIWDSGRELRYRAGENGKYDLRVFDTAPSGVCHTNVTCDICGEKEIHGLRWKCCDCHDFDMCSPCYMADKHDLKHAFVRVDTPNSTAFNVPTRSKSGSNKKTAKGIFPNAEVMRGPHWKWKNDDGGEGGVGLVKALETWGKDSYRGAVKISWKADNLVKNYRVGGEGCVDVIYTRMTETASGGNYYADHLPFVDVVNPGQILLKIGDKVVITLPLKGFRQLQDNQAYGGWDDDMNQCLEETGTIVGFLYNGMSVKVQYEDSKTWVINKVALTRKHTFTQGDPVTILDNYNAVKELQKGHGGWNDEMKTALGKNGRIVRLDSDGDMRIKIGDKTWIFNPACIMPIDDASTAKSIPVLSRQDTRDHSDDESETGSEGDEGGQAVAEAIAQLFVAMLREGPGTEEENDSIVEAAAKGEFDVVKKIVKKHPDKINTKMEGKTALQLACYEGHSQIVEFLVKNKADVNIKDSEGDPALHYAAYGKESKILQVLLDNKAIVNAVNAKKQSALHIAVNKGQPNCCKVLVDKGCDPNLKDDDFDTAMHDAISQKDTSKDILKYVLGSKMAKFTTENSRGFNVLHWAVLKDNKDSVEMIIGNDRSCVNSKMKDGSTAMHIAAANDRVEIASVLQSKGKADINIRDSMKRTPLILAVSQGKKKTMELLITVDCDVNAQDSSGNTALHVAQVKKNLGQAVALDKAASSSQDTAIICLLLESGANIEIKNDEGKTPLDFANDEMVKHFMKTLAKRAKKKDFTTTAKGIPAPSNWSDMCGETVLKISIGPTKGGIMQIEFDNVKHLFEKTLPQARIVSIHRMQNMFLWEMYYLKKRRLEREYGNGCANELVLFHGTTPDKLDVIAEQNLDPRLAGGRVGALFGRGTYFATDAKYSDLYAQADQDGHKFMFLVKVLAGKTCIGRPEYLRPPPQDTKNPNSPLFDSCVDNEKNPRIYCAFHDTQYYPEHLIEYT
ncbi:E3 ubiquitin-protein ligase mind-bomb [Mytilus galloprovincialis]|uniref:Poly [ADP-ribose] polymerase n=1 Tax=Mytilus galloprovincialis TaxID=29158 RepID=A0A8B6CCV4_MYTGA|nr:E3 ubiquitin-protein ligase mind-bomb [Mytilus galloprovincialis]